ncbi:MAG: hypothetical protein L0191_07405, partial [Acidobacteria bacterium]|nr:hypothetical protein [Acidobacteriota bacterium]
MPRPEGWKEGAPAAPVETKTGPPGMPVPPAVQQGKAQYVSLNFENADLELVLRSIADITGINFIIGPGVKAAVTMRTTTKVPASGICCGAGAATSSRASCSARRCPWKRWRRSWSARDRPSGKAFRSPSDT